MCPNILREYVDDENETPCTMMTKKGKKNAQLTFRVEIIRKLALTRRDIT